jgi:Bacterial TSP3 repeat
MKTLVALCSTLCFAAGLQAATTIDPVNHFAYGANIGWIESRGDTNNGAVIGEYVCSGYLYSANVGWINLGTGSPANHIQYQNNSGSDFGVNNDGLGNLRGYAYGANIGWINFENTGAPKVDLKTGKLSGYIYSANVGWISLSNAVAFVQTDIIASGADTDGDGLPDAWEYQHFGNLSATPNADPDGDGMTNLQEYLADTDPLNASDNLRITSFNTTLTPAFRQMNLTWTSKPTRCYFIQKQANLDPASLWLDCGLGAIASGGSFTSASYFDAQTPSRFSRIQAQRPLAP